VRVASLPIAAVETMPIRGVVRLASMAGPAMAKTRLLVTDNPDDINAA